LRVSVVQSSVLKRDDIYLKCAQEPLTPDVPTCAIAKDTFIKNNDVVKLTGSNPASYTRPKRNVGTYKDGPAKERQTKQRTHHSYHTPD